MKISTYPLSSLEQEEFEAIAKECGHESGYKWLASSGIPTAIPETLRDKMPSALLMWEHTSNNCIYLAINGIRIDETDNALDQEPFGIAIYSSGASTSGIFIHHGPWDNRTTPITSDVIEAIGSTSIGNYFPLFESPQASSGPLIDLKGTSHENAFRELFLRIEED